MHLTPIKNRTPGQSELQHALSRTKSYTHLHTHLHTRLHIHTTSISTSAPHHQPVTTIGPKHKKEHLAALHLSFTICFIADFLIFLFSSEINGREALSETMAPMGRFSEAKTLLCAATKDESEITPNRLCCSLSYYIILDYRDIVVGPKRKRSIL